MHKPWHSLIFGVVVFLAMALISWCYPPGGISIGNKLSLNFPTIESLLHSDHAKKDITDILRSADEAERINDFADDADTAFRIEGAPKDRFRKNDSLVKLITGIQSRSKTALKKFFDALQSLKSTPQPAFHVLHYGDSQIEGDRITDYLREKWQSQFGGGGTGLVSLMPLTQSIITRITVSAGWDRYNIFTAKDKRVIHNNYGVLAGFTRYSGYKTIYDTSIILTASVGLSTTKNGGANARNYKKIRLFYGGAKRKTWCEFYDGPALMSADSLLAGGVMNVKEFNVNPNSYDHLIKFRGKDSPDIYGLSFESESGIMVDNIAMRGSSGTFFHQINNDQLKQFYSDLNVKLIILQFGGNTLPAIENETMAVNYAGYLRGQITILKKLAPNASILFVGPSDMNIKVGTDYITYPYLEKLRDEIKKIVLESDCAFFDLYDCMGGRNSMSSWVDAKLAAPDYIHFSPQGARKIATLFYSALMNEYNSYLKTK